MRRCRLWGSTQKVLSLAARGACSLRRPRSLLALRLARSARLLTRSVCSAWLTGVAPLIRKLSGLARDAVGLLRGLGVALALLSKLIRKRLLRLLGGAMASLSKRLLKRIPLLSLGPRFSAPGDSLPLPWTQARFWGHHLSPLPVPAPAPIPTKLLVGILIPHPNTQQSFYGHPFLVGNA